jgi:hypothetical protein
MRSCHPSITALYAAYKDARYIYLLMELAPSGNLYQMLMAMPVPPVSALRAVHMTSLEGWVDSFPQESDTQSSPSCTLTSVDQSTTCMRGAAMM